MLVLLWHYEPISPARNLAKTIFYRDRDIVVSRTHPASLLTRENTCASELKNLELPSHPNEAMPAELDALKRDAGKVLRELRNIRRFRDVSFQEDAELNRRKRENTYVVLKHLLVGHEGKPCPAGDMPYCSCPARVWLEKLICNL